MIIFVCLFPWAKDIYALLAKPLLAALPQGGHLIATEVTAPFFVPVKVTMLAAFLIALPWVLYQAWAFIAPGLYEHEKRLGLPIIVSAVVLFITGMAFAYFAVFPIVFGAIVGFTPAGVEMATDIGKYVDFVLTLFLAFGITFEVPGRGGLDGEVWLGFHRQAGRYTALRHCRFFCHRRHFYPPGHTFSNFAGGALVAVV